MLPLSPGCCCNLIEISSPKAYKCDFLKREGRMFYNYLGEQIDGNMVEPSGADSERSRNGVPNRTSMRTSIFYVRFASLHNLFWSKGILMVEKTQGNGFTLPVSQFAPAFHCFKSLPDRDGRSSSLKNGEKRQTTVGDFKRLKPPPWFQPIDLLIQISIISSIVISSKNVAWNFPAFQKGTPGIQPRGTARDEHTWSPCEITKMSIALLPKDLSVNWNWSLAMIKCTEYYHPISVYMYIRAYIYLQRFQLSAAASQDKTQVQKPLLGLQLLWIMIA